VGGRAGIWAVRVLSYALLSRVLCCHESRAVNDTFSNGLGGNHFHLHHERRQPALPIRHLATKVHFAGRARAAAAEKLDPTPLLHFGTGTVHDFNFWLRCLSLK
jgi:hypothetical protein